MYIDDFVMKCSILTRKQAHKRM